MRTSISHPLQIAELRPFPHMGRIGVTFCPGKTQLSAMSGAWSRDLGTDLDAIRDWNTCAVLTLVENRELTALKVQNMGEEVRARHMDWFHLPIRDVSTPDAVFEMAWQTIGEQLRARLRQGFDVVVHCKGGLGRAGTIAARLMVELGCDPAEAVARVRQVRPGAIETGAQERHVLGQRPVREPVPDTSAEAIRDRSLGALLGLAMGDAVGTTLEFAARDTYAPLTSMTGGGPFRLNPGEWTDDTSMALALADSLYACNGLDEADLMRRFGSWQRGGQYSHNGRCFDIGITTSEALARWRRTKNPVAGSTDPMSAGNGSLMRLAPVAIRFWKDRKRLTDAAARQSRTTHAASEAVDACVAYAHMLADAIAGRPLGEILSRPEVICTGRIGAIVGGSWRGKPRGEVRATGYVAHSLEAALWSVGRSGGDFRTAVLTAANLGEDADTTAAIAGQLAGAAGGEGALPPPWIDRLAWYNRIRNMADAIIDF